jgi:hypothetical protein
MCYMYCLFHRYKLTFMAFDGTTEAQMFSFDNIARAIIGKPRASLVGPASNTFSYVVACTEDEMASI